jgi:glutathione S-transferase
MEAVSGMLGNHTDMTKILCLWLTNPPFSPFVQRVWVALEAKGIPYQYIEVDPYKKPESLLAVNPRGLVPALQHGNWGCYESTVLLEYVGCLHPFRPSVAAVRYPNRFRL